MTWQETEMKRLTHCFPIISIRIRPGQKYKIRQLLEVPYEIDPQIKPFKINYRHYQHQPEEGSRVRPNNGESAERAFNCMI